MHSKQWTGLGNRLDTGRCEDTGELFGKCSNFINHQKCKLKPELINIFHPPRQ